MCDEQRRRGVDIYYAEGRHLYPLGDGGPAELENLLVLCPNYHADFDYGTTAVDPARVQERPPKVCKGQAVVKAPDIEVVEVVGVPHCLTRHDS